MNIKPRKADPQDSTLALARELAEALERRRREDDGLVLACGVAWTLVDLLAPPGRAS